MFPKQVRIRVLKPVAQVTEHGPNSVQGDQQDPASQGIDSVKPPGQSEISPKQSLVLVLKPEPQVTEHSPYSLH